MANPAKDDTTNYYVGLALFSALVPILFFLSVALSPEGASTRPRDTAAAPAAGEAADEAPAPAE